MDYSISACEGSDAAPPGHQLMQYRISGQEASTAAHPGFQPFRFLKLPAEVRTLVYGEALREEQGVVMYGKYLVPVSVGFP
jgi:hypothetical protein